MAPTHPRFGSFLRVICRALVFVLVLILTTFAHSQSANDIVYVYDELGRLVAVIDPNGEAAVYRYDTVGNILSITRYSSTIASVIEFTPNSGPVGTNVTIYGTGFSTTTTQNVIAFNGVSATVTSSTATKIVTTVPAGATTGPITITTPAGSAASSTPFIVGEPGQPTITDFSPTVGVAGTAVTINGTNFEATPQRNKSKFNVTHSTISDSTGTSITTTVPTGSTSGPIKVTTPVGSVTSSADFFVPPSPYTAANVDVTGRMAYGDNRTVALPLANKIGLIVFDGVVGQRASIKVTTSTFSGVIRINSPTGAQMASLSFGTSGGYLETSILPLTGTYTILVDPTGTATGQATFTLYDASDVTSGITIDGSSIAITVAIPGQNRVLSFTGTAGQRVSVGMSGVSIGTSTCCGSEISIKNPDGSILLAPVDVGTLGHGTPTVALPVSGTYSLVVDPDAAVLGSATITLSEEINALITINGSQVALSVSRAGQNARLPFEGTSGQRVSVGMSGVSIGTSTCCGSEISIKNPDGSILLAPVDVGTLGYGTPTVVLPASGTFTIDVDPDKSNTGNATITLSEEINTPITINGSQVPLSVSRSGQNATLPFEGTSGQRVSVGMSGVTISTSTCCGAQLSIKNPDGSILLAPADVGTLGHGTPTIVLPASGTFTIVVDPNKANTGNATITLSEEINTPITINGSQVALSVSRSGQNATLPFEGTSGQRVSVGMSGVTISTSTCCGAQLSIRNPDGSILFAPVDFGTSGNGTPTVVLPVSGTFTIVVDPNKANTGNATITLSEDLSAAITIGDAALAMTINRVGQNAFVTFSAVAGQQATVRVTGNTINNVTCALFKPDGTQITSMSSSSSSFNLTTQTLPVTGTYRITINPPGAFTGSISVRVTSP